MTEPRQMFKGLPFFCFVNKKGREIGYYKIGKVLFPQPLMFKVFNKKKGTTA